MIYNGEVMLYLFFQLKEYESLRRNYFVVYCAVYIIKQIAITSVIYYDTVPNVLKKAEVHIKPYRTRSAIFVKVTNNQILFNQNPSIFLYGE